MSNTYFQFKEFIVHQNKAALKVCTDACCLGALIAPKAAQAQNILDLGCGTGLLSLMLAQFNQAIITGIDIHQPSVEQATQNFSLSKWSNRLQALQADVNNYTGTVKFDWIITNPPFFENVLRSQTTEEQLAKHLEADGWQVWIDAIARNLLSTGKVALLIPFTATEKVKAAFEKAAFYTEEVIYLYHQANRPAFRSILIFNRITSNFVAPQHFIIKEPDQQYTTAFQDTMRAYYLHL
jgi:tRNA1Val (adenine37-N6)-methyltransferase